jgi:hypothetical protein
MNAPAPVDLSRLKSILGNAKQIMNKVETNNFKGGNIDPRIVNEDGISEIMSEGRMPNMVAPNMSAPTQYTQEMVERSNLPPAIKKAMIENQIPTVSNPLSHSFSLNDVVDLVDKPVGYPKPRTRVNESYEQPRQSSNSNLITIDRRELDNIIKENVIKILTDSYNKTITEDAIKRTIRLIAEGKIAIKKK